VTEGLQARLSPSLTLAMAQPLWNEASQQVSDLRDHAELCVSVG
jgi:hypothetical protein